MSVRSRRYAAIAAFVWLAAGAWASAPTGFGTFADRATIGGMSNWRAHVKLMKEFGMNTFVITFSSPEELRDEIDTAIEENMLDTRIPIFAMANCGPALYAQIMPNWAQVVAADQNPMSGWASGEVDGWAYCVRYARTLSKYPDKWPEILAYNVDEPGHGEAGVDLSHVGTITDNYNRRGFRSGTGCCWPNIKNMTDKLDIICVNIINGGDLRGCKETILAAGKEFWAYDIHLAHQKPSPETVRYCAGMWTWLVQPRVRLSWCWREFVTGDMSNPEPTEQLVAYGEGVKDFHHLSATEDRLKQYRAEFDWEGYQPSMLNKPGEGEQFDFDFDAMLPARND